MSSVSPVDPSRLDEAKERKRTKWRREENEQEEDEEVEEAQSARLSRRSGTGRKGRVLICRESRQVLAETRVCAAVVNKFEAACRPRPPPSCAAHVLAGALWPAPTPAR